jgi:hypothetical protein
MPRHGHLAWFVDPNYVMSLVVLRLKFETRDVTQVNIFRDLAPNTEIPVEYFECISHSWIVYLLLNYLPSTPNTGNLCQCSLFWLDLVTIIKELTISVVIQTYSLRNWKEANVCLLILNVLWVTDNYNKDNISPIRIYESSKVTMTRHLLEAILSVLA